MCVRERKRERGKIVEGVNEEEIYRGGNYTRSLFAHYYMYNNEAHMQNNLTDRKIYFKKEDR